MAHKYGKVEISVVLWLVLSISYFMIKIFYSQKVACTLDWYYVNVLLLVFSENLQPR